MARTEITQYGFNFGPAVVERLCSDDKKCWEGSGRSRPLGFIFQSRHQKKLKESIFT